MTKKERDTRFRKLSDLGCSVCRMPAEIHHLSGYEFGSGMGLKAPDKFTIPLCPNHHRGYEGFHTIGKLTWEEKFGTQKYHLTTVNEKLASMEAIK